MKTLFIVFFSTVMLFSQEFECTVTANFENLPVINKENLMNFAQTVQDYMNQTKFTGENWNEPKIKCTFNIFFTSGEEQTYSAQVFIGSQRPLYKSDRYTPMITILDNNWSFAYEKNQTMYFNPNIFNSLNSFFDYYAYVILGFDFDSYEKLAGTNFFSRAMDIVGQAGIGKFANGWEKKGSGFNRRGLVEELLNEKYRPFREAFFEYHYNGLDIFTENPKAAQENIAALINTLDGMRGQLDFNSVLMKIFFDAKHTEIIEYLKNYSKKEVFQALKRIDPSHAGKYDEALK